MIKLPEVKNDGKSRPPTNPHDSSQLYAEFVNITGGFEAVFKGV